MCDSLTAPYVEDCSYSAASIENCEITNAVTGEFYILLITNFSNTNCNIDFSQTAGNGSTDCCILGDAGDDNLNPGVTKCSSDSSILLENQLYGTPSSGGTWYDSNWNIISNIFNPNVATSGTYSYIVLGSPPAGSTTTCPDDTASLLINVNANPIITFPSLDEMCEDDSPLALNIAIPAGGIYSGNGVNTNTFTPSSSIIGLNNIEYNLTDINGCSASGSQIINVNEKPSVNLGLDIQIPCRDSFSIIPIITGGEQPYNYSWSNGSNNPETTVSEGQFILVLSDINGCIDSDDITVTQDITPTATISGGGEICNDGSSTEINFSFNGLLPWNLTYSNGSASSSVYNINTENYIVTTSISGLYNIILADDPNACEADILGEDVGIIVNELPTPIIQPQFYEIFPGEEVILNTGIYSSYYWYNDSDSLISSNEFLVVDSTLISYVIVESEDGCFGTSSNSIINFIPRVEFFIPNTFTPNGDEHNDLLTTIGNNIDSFSMSIINRWGEIIFYTDNINKFWDGKFNGYPIKQGTYSYKVNIIGKNKRPFTKTGTVKILF
jgi:gliding motility-associated-like protein